VRPTEDEQLLHNLTNLDKSQLRSEFTKGISDIHQIILSSAKLKSVNNKLINGSNIISLAESYTQSINEKGMPVIQTAWN